MEKVLFSMSIEYFRSKNFQCLEESKSALENDNFEKFRHLLHKANEYSGYVSDIRKQRLRNIKLYYMIRRNSYA